MSTKTRKSKREYSKQLLNTQLGGAAGILGISASYGANQIAHRGFTKTLDKIHNNPVHTKAAEAVKKKYLTQVNPLVGVPVRDVTTRKTAGHNKALDIFGGGDNAGAGVLTARQARHIKSFGSTIVQTTGRSSDNPVTLAHELGHTRQFKSRGDQIGKLRNNKYTIGLFKKLRRFPKLRKALNQKVNAQNVTERIFKLTRGSALGRGAIGVQQAALASAAAPFLLPHYFTKPNKPLSKSEKRKRQLVTGAAAGVGAGAAGLGAHVLYNEANATHRGNKLLKRLNPAYYKKYGKLIRSQGRRAWGTYAALYAPSIAAGGYAAYKGISANRKPKKQMSTLK